MSVKSKRHRELQTAERRAAGAAVEQVLEILEPLQEVSSYALARLLLALGRLAERSHGSSAVWPVNRRELEVWEAGKIWHARSGGW